MLKSDLGVDKIMDALHKDIAPDAHDSAYRDVVAFFGLRRTHETLDEYIGLFQRALRRIEARLPDGAMFPDIVISSLRLHHAGLSPTQKSLVLASTGGDNSLETMKKRMRRILQPCGMDVKRDALIVNNDMKVLNSTSSYTDDSDVKADVGDAQIASKKKRKNKQKKGKDPIQQPRLSGGGNLNRVNPRTGYRNRCFGCGGEFHLLPNCPGKQPQEARRVSITMDPPD